MKTFIEIIKLNLKVFLQYKWGFAMSLVMQPIIIMINIALFTSIFQYNNTNSIKGYTLDQMIWYFNAASFVFIFIWNFTDVRISERILSGELAIDLLRPVSVFRVELGNAIALRTVGVLFEFVPGIILYSLIFFPTFLTIVSTLKFIALAMLAFLLYFLFNFLLGLLAFVVKNNTSLSSLRVTLVAIAGGSMIPMEFYPKWLYDALEFLPFKHMFYWPVQIFLNKPEVQSMDFMIRTITIILIWMTTLYVLCKVLWKLAVRQFASVGG